MSTFVKVLQKKTLASFFRTRCTCTSNCFFDVQTFLWNDLQSRGSFEGAPCKPALLWVLKGFKTRQDAVLSQGGPRDADAVVYFDRFRILQRHPAVSLPQHDSLI